MYPLTESIFLSREDRSFKSVKSLRNRWNYWKISQIFEHSVNLHCSRERRINILPFIHFRDKTRKLWIGKSNFKLKSWLWIVHWTWGTVIVQFKHAYFTKKWLNNFLEKLVDLKQYQMDYSIAIMSSSYSTVFLISLYKIQVWNERVEKFKATIFYDIY